MIKRVEIKNNALKNYLTDRLSNKKKIIDDVLKEYRSAKVIKPNVSFVKPALNKIKTKLIKKNLGNLEVEEILNKAFSSKNIEFVHGFGTSGDPKYAQIYISNASILENGAIQIEYENDFYKLFEDDYEWNGFVKGIQSVIEHELVHREQLKRIFKKVPSNYKYQNILRMMQVSPENVAKYLGKKHEAMSFAQEAVTEFRNDKYSDEQIKKLLRRPLNNQGPSAQESHIFWTYAEWFETKDKEFKQFLKYMFGYLS